MLRDKRVLAALVLLAIGAFPRCAWSYGEATFGTQWWKQTEPEAKFEEFRDVPRGALLESFLVRGGGEKWKSTLYGANALREDQLIGGSLARGIRWQLDGRWKQIPHHISEVARFGYLETAPGVFVLPDSLQGRNQADPGGYTNRIRDYFNGAAQRVPVGFRTDVADARLRARPSQGWQLEFKGERRNRTGNKPYGTTLGFSDAIEMLEPIRQKMWDGDAAASYMRGRWTARFSGGYSAFDNDVDALVWDSPRRLTDKSTSSGASRGRLDLYPNNHAVRGTAGVLVRLPKAATFSANVGVARLSQNDRWLPFTINSAFPDSLLQTLYTTPDRSTQAKAVRLNVDSRLAGRVVGNLHGAIRYRQSRYDNQTPVHAFRGFINYDQSIDPARAVADSLVETRPFGNDLKTIGADLDYALGDRVTLDGTLEHRIRTHEEREVDRDKEEYVRVHAGVEATADVRLEAAVYQGIRVLDHFFLDDYHKAESPDSVLLELPGLRRFDLANRHQRGASAALDWAVSDRVDLGVDFTHERNRFPESVYGLRAEEINEGMAQADVKLSKRVDMSGGFGRNVVSTDQQSNETNTPAPPTPDAPNDWRARIHDRNDFAFGELGYRASERLRLELGYQFSRDQADYDLWNGSGTARNLPDTFYRRHDASARANYRLAGGTELGLRYQFEQYDVVDFASQDIPLVGLANGTATAVYLGDDSLPYHAHVVSLVATRRF